MIINFDNLGGGGGGSYTLPTATASRLGGVKIGSGVTVTDDGTISVEGSDSSVLKSVAELPSDAELGDVVSLASEGGYPDGITYERRTYTDGDGVRFTFPDGSLTGHTSDNPVFLGTVKANNYPGSAYEMYAVYDSESYINSFTITLNGDLSDPNCVIYMSDGEQGVTTFEGVAYEFDIVGQDMIIDVYPDSSMMVPSLVFEGLPESGSLGVFQYDGEEWNQIGAGGGSADYIPEITELPETPVDGAIYNYNGTLIKYVDGAGNWGEWTGADYIFTYNRDNSGSATLFYSVIPASMDGGLAFGLGYIKSYSSQTQIWCYFNLTDKTIDVYNNSGKTGTTLYTIGYESGSETYINDSSVQAYVSWNNNVIQIRPNTHYTQMLVCCDTNIATGHYELSQPIERKYPAFSYSKPGGSDIVNYLTTFDGSGDAYPGDRAYKRTIYVNNAGYSNPLVYYGTTDGAPMQRMFVPVTSGETGTLCVSQGANSAPVFKTVAQALGVSFWTGTQDEYDDLGTYSPTTLYIIIPE